MAHMVRWRETNGITGGRDAEDEHTRQVMEQFDVHALDSPHYAQAAACVQVSSDKRMALQRLFLTVLQDARKQTVRRIQE